MLFYQEPDIQQRCKEKFLQDVRFIQQFIRGPYLSGKVFSWGDILVAPYMQRMFVLEHYRGFTVPQTGEYSEWRKWSKQVLKQESTKAVTQ